ncbi:UNVERIFIED_CONTAM: hypothetical protein GTU68_022588, partial [Idotea baltica]|nr:hypothetical protein [Idotea baltica]
MGYHMAGHLVAAGHDVTVWNRTAAKSERWATEHKGDVALDPASAIKDADFVLLCLGDDPDVWDVFDKMQDAISSGMIIVDHTTASAGLARELHQRCNQKSASFIDAPISGGEAGAINGQLAIMCGGDAQPFAKAEPIMAAYGKQMTLIGDSGAGQLAKSVNQICIAGIVQGLSEGLHFAEKSGLDVEKVIAAISGGAAQSWQMNNRWKTMSDGAFEHGFAVDWMRKDLRIALDAARSNGASLPVTAQV